LFLIGTKRFKNVKASFVANGLAIREHKNSRRLPHNTLPHECTVHVVKFLQNFAEVHAILLPGNMPGYKRDDVQLLPSNTTKKAVWVQYKISCDQAGLQAAAYTTFAALWRQLTPQIRVMKPMSDLCWVCQKNSVAIMRAANKPESAKSDVRTQLHTHLP
jgi:hypothetical protein